MPSYAKSQEIWKLIRPKISRKSDYVVAIDGPDCSGKTTLAESLVRQARSEGCRVESIHLDDTFVSRVERPRCNPDAVSEFILEFFEHDCLEQSLGEKEGLVIVEGMFLLRAPTKELFDFTVRLELDERSVFERALRRDREQFSSWGDFALHYVSQCLAAQRLYRWFCQPERVADLTVTLSDR